MAEVGPGVDHFKAGDEVIVQPSGSCGVCRYCREGNTHYCDHSFVTGGDGPEDIWPGAFAEYMRTRASCLYPKPPGLSFDAAALTEPLSGAWKGVIQYSEMRVGDSAVVIGVGGIGLLCLMVAHAAGAGRADRGGHRARTPAPRRCGWAPRTRSTPVTEIFATASTPQSREGRMWSIEAAGPIQAVKDMVSLLRRGTRWNVFGITTHETFELDGGLAHFLEARMDASFGTTPLAMQSAIRLMEAGLVNTEEIISHRFPLTKIHEAIEVMGQPDRNKIMIHP